VAFFMRILREKIIYKNCIASLYKLPSHYYYQIKSHPRGFNHTHFHLTKWVHTSLLSSDV
jgi:hypothetical protein